MKDTKLMLLLFFASIIVSDALAQNCGIATAQVDLSGNNVRARLHASASWWWDGGDGRYIYPSAEPGSGIPERTAIFAGGLWIGGKDAAGNFLLASSEYGLGQNNTDFFPGPLDENGETTENTCANFDKFFGANSQDINTHIADFQDNGMIDNTVPNSILGWPGFGNPNFFEVHSFDLPSNNSPLAPFIDQNSNGLYEPMQGDYPDTKLADQAWWWVFNDNGGPHTESQGSPLGFEIQMLAYAYSSADPAINDATFYDLKMINKSGQTVEDFYTSLWIDPDLGCYTDDYIGCIPSENIGYVYNMDEIDGDNGCDCSFGVNTYCDEIPVVGIKLLEGLTDYENGMTDDLGMTSFMYYNNAAINNPPSGTTDPSIVTDYYNLMQGLWGDGTPLTYGGTGYNPGGETTEFAFPDSPSDAAGWSMCSANSPQNDPRILMNTGPINSVPGSIHRISFAVIAEANVPHPCPDVSGLIENGNTVQEVFEDPTDVSNIIYNNNQLTISPNPFSEQTIISLNNASQMIQSVKLYSIDGRQIRNIESINQNTYSMKRADLNDGMYVYLLTTTDGKLMSGKILASQNL